MLWFFEYFPLQITAHFRQNDFRNESLLSSFVESQVFVLQVIG